MRGMLATTLIVATGVMASVSISPALGDPPESWCRGCSIYGDGSDGDKTVGSHVMLNLMGDVEYENLTIEANGTLNTNGHIVRVCGTLWVKSGGLITDLSSGGDGGAGGDHGKGGNPSHAPEDLTGCGRVTEWCTVGEDGDPGQAPVVPQAGAGGEGGGGGGGGGGAWHDLSSADADGGNGGDGGEGADGGGYVRIYAFHIINEGAIHADGEDGEDGDHAPFGYWNCGAEYYAWLLHDLAGGGGGGGGGGCGGDGGTVDITIAQHNLDLGNAHANGGAGGQGGDGGLPENYTGELEHGVLDGGHQPGCPGGNGCGDGGDGGRGAHRPGYSERAMPGDDGQDGDDGAPGACGGTRCCWPGDVDQDCDVDLADMAALFSAYCHVEGEPEYNACADFDDDGHVGLPDLAALLGNYPCDPEPVDCP